MLNRLNFKKIHRFFLKLCSGWFLGGVLIFFLFKKTDFSHLAYQFHSINYQYVGLAIICYCISIVLRAFRWKILLNTAYQVGVFPILVSMVSGYMVNLLLPARVGEYYRIDFCYRYFSLSRMRVLGSMIIERAMDGLAIIGIFVFGLMNLNLDSRHLQLFKITIFTGLAIFGGIILLMYLLSYQRIKNYFLFYKQFERILENFFESISMIRTKKILKGVIFLVIIWIFEIITFKLTLGSIAINLSLAQLCLTVGVVSLSTMLPSAPAFLGTLQYAYFITLNLWGYGLEQSLAIASLHQSFIFGPMIFFGLFFYSMILFSKNFRNCLTLAFETDEIKVSPYVPT